MILLYNKTSMTGFNKEEVFIVKFIEKSTGRIVEINPRIDNPYWDTLIRFKVLSGEYVLSSGELPDKWK